MEIGNKFQQLVSCEVNGTDSVKPASNSDVSGTKDSDPVFNSGKTDAKSQDMRIAKERIDDYEIKDPKTGKKIKGTLTKFDDGSCVFVIKNKDANGNETVSKLNFDNEKALKKNLPSLRIDNANNPEKRRETTFNYQNGKLASSETKDIKGNVLAQCEYNADGKMSIQKQFKNGNIVATSKFTYNADKSYSMETVDKNNVIVKQEKYNAESLLQERVNYKDGKPDRTDKLTYNDDKSFNVETLDKNNNVVQRAKHSPDGKALEKITYKNGEVVVVDKFKYNEDKTSIVESYDKNNNLKQTIKFNAANKREEIVSYKDGKINGTTKYKYNEDGSYSTEKYNADNKLDSVVKYDKTGRMIGKIEYDENGNVLSSIENSSDEIDGEFGLSAQVSEGDCYLMGTINSIKMTEGGPELLKNLVKTSTNEKGEKVYTVSLPGAQAMAKELEAKGIKSSVTGEYTFTESEFQEILKQSGKKYSLGDADVILLEAAFEKYRMEAAETMKANPGDEAKKTFKQLGLMTGKNPDNILAGGQAWDSTYILTGNKCDFYFVSDFEYGLNSEALHNGDVVPEKRTESTNSSSPSSPESQAKLNTMLDQLAEDSKDGHIDRVAVAGFATMDGNGKIAGGHALTIKSVTADSVILVNPWFPDKDITMSREDFVKSVKSLSVSQDNVAELDTAKPDDPSAPESTGGAVSPGNGGSSNGSENSCGIYTVRMGDNLWKIAKNHLGPNASGTEIANYIDKIMEANPNLKWDKTHTKVMIHPRETINLP